MSNYRSGFVSLVGRPNTGKSTLVNALVGRKVAITSARPQTTRNRIMAIYTGADFQVVFLDTPGVHKPHDRLGELMNEVTRRTLNEVDLVCHVVDAAVPVGRGEELLCASLRRLTSPVFLVLNKIDLARPADLALCRERLLSLVAYAGTGEVCALSGEGLPQLTTAVAGFLPEGPQYFPPGQVTDQPEELLMAELVREQVLTLTRDEVPHAVQVVLEELEPRPNALLYLRMAIHVERESQKGILIGRGGTMLKEVGRRAREEIEALLGNRVYLDLVVKVSRDWRRREDLLGKMGFRSETRW